MPARYHACYPALTDDRDFGAGIGAPRLALALRHHHNNNKQQPEPQQQQQQQLLAQQKHHQQQQQPQKVLSRPPSLRSNGARSPVQLHQQYGAQAVGKEGMALVTVATTLHT